MHVCWSHRPAVANPAPDAGFVKDPKLMTARKTCRSTAPGKPEVPRQALRGDLHGVSSVACDLSASCTNASIRASPTLWVEHRRRSRRDHRLSLATKDVCFQPVV